MPQDEGLCKCPWGEGPVSVGTKWADAELAFGQEGSRADRDRQRGHDWPLTLGLASAQLNLQRGHCM